MIGCASLTEEQCLEGDWWGIGNRDGVAGYDKSRLSDHVKACEDVGVVPDAKRWEVGRREGLKTYCTAASAYEVGRSGQKIGTVCDRALLQKMQEAWAHGRQYYEISREISSLEQNIFSLRGEILLELDATGGDTNAEVFFLRGEILSIERQIARLLRLRQRFATWPV